MSPDPLAIANAAAQGFKNLECVECVRAVKAALASSGFGGEVLRLRGRQGAAFIVCFSYNGGTETITETGIHQAVRIGDTVIDNLHPDGIAYSEWLLDFDAYGGVDCAIVDVF